MTTTTRPQLPEDVPVLNRDGRGYVRECDLPEPARTKFVETMTRTLAQVPVIEGEAGRCFYRHDWELFLERWQRSQ